MDTKQELPNATLVLVLGIASIVTCFCYGIIGLIVGIIAIVIANKSLTQYKANPDWYTGYETLKAGRICAIVGVVASALYLVVVIIYLLFFLFAMGAGASDFPWNELQNELNTY